MLFLEPWLKTFLSFFTFSWKPYLFLQFSLFCNLGGLQIPSFRCGPFLCCSFWIGSFRGISSKFCPMLFNARLFKKLTSLWWINLRFSLKLILIYLRISNKSLQFNISLSFSRILPKFISSCCTIKKRCKTLNNLDYHLIWHIIQSSTYTLQSNI